MAVEEKISRNPDGTLQSVKVPVAPAKGWNMFNATATNDTLLLLLGLVCLFVSGLLVFCRSSAKFGKRGV